MMAPPADILNKASRNPVRVVAILILMAIAVYLGYREFTPRRSPVITSLMSFVDDAREDAVSSGSRKILEFNEKDNNVVLKTDSGSGEPVVEKTYEIEEPFALSYISFPENALVFGSDGTPEEGGEIEITQYSDASEAAGKEDPDEGKIVEITNVEVSPSDGEVWILNDEYTAYNRFGAWVGAICVFAIFSYLYKENKFYRVFEHVLLGVSIGFSAAIVIYQVLYLKLWTPMIDGGFRLFFRGVRSSGIWFNMSLVFPGIIGLLWFFQYSKKYLWLNRIAVGITAGAAAGLGIKYTLVSGYPQITETFYNLALQAQRAPHLGPLERWRISFENILMLVIVCCVVYYFFFSFRRRSDLSKAPASMGRMFLMISLGAFFGNTFLTRVVILIDRIQFLLRDWLMVR